MHDVKRAVTHDDLFLTRPRADNCSDLGRAPDLVADELATGVIHHCSPLSRQGPEPTGSRLGDRFRIPERCLAPVVDLGEDAPHALLEAHLLRPAEIAPDLGNIGEGAIRLARTLGNVDDRPTEQFDEAVDRLRIARSPVPHLAVLVGLGGHLESFGYVGDVEEIPRLPSVAHDGEGLICELLLEKYAEYGAVGA